MTIVEIPFPLLFIRGREEKSVKRENYMYANGRRREKRGEN